MNDKYSRQQLFAPIGHDGQEKIRQAKIFILGAGALGSSAAEMLARAGVGSITIVDRDIIEWTNLHRQQLYTEQNVIDQLPKAIAAERRLREINRDVNIKGIIVDVTPENILELINGHDLIVDATDNIEIRLLANDAAMQLGIPLFMGACVGSYGLTFPIGIGGDQPCLHCLLETLPSQSLTCDTVGVISPIVVTISARQVANVLKYITGHAIEPKLESTDLWKGQSASIDVKKLKKQNCPSCSSKRTYPFLRTKDSLKTAVLCGRDTVQLAWPKKRKFNLSLFAQTIEGTVDKLISNHFLVACEYEGHRIVLFQDGRMLIHGTKNTTQAKKIATKLLG